MVYFEKGSKYGSNPTIRVLKLTKDYMTYRFENGKAEYTVPIYWARLKTIEHPVQFIRVRGKPIWAVEKK